MDRLGDKLRLQSRITAVKNLNLQLLKQKIENEGSLSSVPYVEIKFGDSEGLTPMVTLEPGKTHPFVASFWMAWGGVESLNVEAAGSSGLKFSWEGVKECSVEQIEQYKGYLEQCSHPVVDSVGQKRQRV